ncbi:helix-turn-helix transcriptional regulator [Streptomyces sp. Ru87]|uniref:helix-turn-helix domain-containing protein n=1 Tax=Streptomyces sp. Ru87 TaxID=2044307 RepID=UPI0015D4ED2C|nr:helix-turn-helix transcriptional regulator [Streptomyces sp. Ru87]
MSGQILALVGRQGQSPPSTPQAAAQLVGALLRHLREQRGLNQGEVVAAVPVIGSVPTLSRYERAAVPFKEDRVFALLHFYRAPQETVGEAEMLMRRSHGQEWWASYSDVVGELLASLFALESTSKVIRVYQETNIPGMLQTAGYARAVMTDYYRAQHNAEIRRKNLATVDRRLEMRLRRQHLLDQPNAPAFEALIAEAVLTKELGGALVMREQLRHLYNLAENKPNVHIRILPGSAMRQNSPLHPAMTLFKPHSPETGRTVYLENKNRGGEFLADPGEVETFQASMDDWWTRALPKQESLKRLVDYINRLADELEG